ncbi:MAG: STAS domain-containing protein [Pseudomonadota bacterium]
MVERLDLPEKLTTEAVPNLIAALQGKAGRDLVLDAGRVVHIGAQAMQTLAVAANDRRKTGHRLDFENLGDRIVQQLCLLGTTPERLAKGEIG